MLANERRLFNLDLGFLSTASMQFRGELVSEQLWDDLTVATNTRLVGLARLSHMPTLIAARIDFRERHKHLLAGSAAGGEVRC